MSTLHGYIRTSRRLITGEPRNDSDTKGCVAKKLGHYLSVGI